MKNTGLELTLNLAVSCNEKKPNIKFVFYQFIDNPLFSQGDFYYSLNSSIILALFSPYPLNQQIMEHAHEVRLVRYLKFGDSHPLRHRPLAPLKMQLDCLI